MRKAFLSGFILVLVAVLSGMGQAPKPVQSAGKLPALQKTFNEIQLLQKRFDFADSLYKTYIESDLSIAPWFAVQLYKLSDSVGTTRARILGNHAMSLSLSYLGDFSGSLPYLDRELELGIQSKDSLVMARAYLNLGDNYIELGRFNLAYLYTSKALETASKSNNPMDVEFATHNLGRVHKELGQYDLAIKYLMASDSMSRKLNDQQAPMYTLRELGDVHLRKKEFLLAAEKLARALELSYSLDIQVLRPDILLDLGRLYTQQGRLELAESFYDSARMLGQQLGNRLVESKCLLGMGMILMAKKQTAEARLLIEQAERIAGDLHARMVQIECLAQLSAVAEQTGDFKDALRFFKGFSQLQDSLFNLELPDQTLKYQMELLREVKDRELSLHQQEIEQQHLYRNILIASIAVMAILLYLVYRADRRRKEANAQLLNHQQELEQRSKELEEINRMKDKFFSIISHDLRSPINTLAGVLNLMEKNGVSPEELPILTRELRLQFNHTRNLITNLLNWALVQMDRISMKKVSLELYPVVEENFRLVRTLSSKQINLVNSVPNGLLVFADNNMIDLVLRNLVLNAVKFTENGGTVMVAAQDEPGQVVIRVQDNGVGIPPDIQKTLLAKNSGYTTLGTANEKGTGLGLGLCVEFIEKHGGKIWLSSQVDAGTTFYFTLPKESVAG